MEKEKSYKPKAYSYIRFSNKHQIDTDSLRRQLKESENYCKQNGLILDETLNLKDLGFSAFKGVHRKKGALGEFLELVHNGEITPGSALIIESIDRLSREPPSEAQHNFLSMIRAGIKIILLDEDKEITKESYDKSDVNEITNSIVRANKESIRKSKMIGAAWKQKREDAKERGVIMTARCPFWLELNPDRKTFTVKPEVVKAIEWIFHKKLQGYGVHRIVTELNQKHDIWSPPISARNQTGGWQVPYVNKLLRNKALLGIFQSRPIREGKTVEYSEPIENYFPQVISPDLFNAVQNLIAKNRADKAGGKTGKAFNVFSGLVYCGNCNGKMHYINNNSKYHYLTCHNSRMKNPNNPCDAPYIPYQEFFTIFFNDFEEFDIDALISDKDERRAEINNLQTSIDAKEYEVTQLENSILNIMDMIEREDDPEQRKIWNARSKERRQQKEQLISKVQELKNNLHGMQENGEKLQASIDTVTELSELLREDMTDERAVELRLKLRQQLRSLVKSITIYPLKQRYIPVEEIEPGIMQTMKSKTMERIKLQFEGAKKLRVILLKTYAKQIE